MRTRNLIPIILISSLGILSACTRTVRISETPQMFPIEGTIQSPIVQNEVSASTIEQPKNITPTIGEESVEVEPARKYSVAFLADGEILNVRSGPGVTFDIIDSLTANTHNLITTGNRETADEMQWVELDLDPGPGWVSGEFITEEMDSKTVCDDPQVGEILDRFVQAVRNRDGSSLAEVISPIHGLTIHHNLWNPPVEFDSSETVQSLFSSDMEYDWGIQDGSGEAIIGSFRDRILPQLEDVLLQNHTRHCNTLERGIATGPTSGYVYWPYDYAAFNYIALFRPAPPDQELDWRTWVAGIEYVDGKPYLVVLIQFYWEI